jgi:electron transfer flavoprotein beta subunit
MDIVVTVKRVPDPNIRVNMLTIDPPGRQVVTPPGIPPVTNGYDANALEEAVRLKEQHGGTVTALGLGDEASRDTLRSAIAVGATAAIHIAGAAGLEADSLSTARLLAAAIRRLARYDLVLCGRQASDTDAGPVLFGVAEILGLPIVSPIRKIVQVEAGAVVVERMSEDGAQRVRVQLPALLGVSSETNQPRYPAMKGVLLARRAQIPSWTRAELGLEGLEASVDLRRVYLEKREGKIEFIEAATPAHTGARLADRLREAGLL